MYSVHVHYPDEPAPRETHALASGADVLVLISQLTASHPACEKIVVFHRAAFLFAVDRDGNRLAD